ncbi:MAG: nucleoside deaminase [Rickettsiaceae bacterium]|nr:nucleoside deaminase [Rickettsiaceae bacterium]
MDQNKFMQLALQMAAKAFEAGEVPVGAVIVRRIDGKIIAKAHNLVESKQSPIKHAEIIALNIASKKLKTKYLQDCDLYVTLEPCPMCASAISMYRLGRLYFGAKDPKFGAVESVTNFFASKNCFHKPDIYSGLYEENVTLLMKNFFRIIRDQKKLGERRCCSL